MKSGNAFSVHRRNPGKDYQTFQFNHHAGSEVSCMLMFSEYEISPHGDLGPSCTEFHILDQMIDLSGLRSCIKPWPVSGRPGEKSQCP